MSSVFNAKLDFWVKNNQNVLFIGRHGVGKTAIVKETFERHGLKWKYFSASTMDPWVDFVGVPREKTEDQIPEQFNIIKELGRINQNLAIDWVVNNWHMPQDQAIVVVHHALNRQEGVTHLDIVRPFSFATGEVEALFFDEFNRSPKKIRNAVMELIQFKSINGHKFPKLKMVWAAINPDEEMDGGSLNYDVEKFDPAQFDRFHVPVAMQYKCDAEWFRATYGQRLADSAIGWWDELNDEEKAKVSPRRLSYALDVFKAHGDLRDILPISCNVSKLNTALNQGPITERMEELLTKKDREGAKKFLENENNFASAMKHIPQSATLMEFFMPLMSKEKLASMMDINEKLGSYIISNIDSVEAFHSVCKEVMMANLNPRLVKKIRRALTEDSNLATAFQQGPNKKATVTRSPAPATYSKSKGDYNVELVSLQKSPVDTEPQRATVFKNILNTIPKKIDSNQAWSTLELLDKLVVQTSNMINPAERSSWEFGSILHSPVFNGKFMGLVNHCLQAIHAENDSTVEQIFKTERNGILKGLLTKITVAGLEDQLPNENFK